MDKLPQTEYIILGILLIAAVLAFPAFRDVQVLQNIFVSFCSGIGVL